MNQDSWNQQLRDKLNNHEENAPQGLWEAIEAALPANGPGTAGGKELQRKARLASLRRWAVAASVAVLIAGGGLWWWRQEERQLEAMAIAETTDRQMEQTVTEVEKPEDTEAETGSDLLACASQEATAQATGSTLTQSTEEPDRDSGIVTPEEVTQACEEASPTDEEATPTDEEVTTTNEKATQAYKEAVKSTPPAHPHQPQPPRQRHKPTTSLNLYATNAIGTHNGSNAVMMADAMARQFTTLQNNSSTAAARQGGPIFLSGYEEREKHHLPLSVGITAGLALTPKLTLTTGLVYTRMQSEFTYVMRGQQVAKEQTLHYIGLPVNANYELWRYGKLKIYATAALQADWNIKARTTTESVEQHTERDRLQWSVRGSVGLQYDLIPQLGLYAEPGISHYFDNGSNVNNYFKDKPTAFSLQMGLRLNLP